MNHNETLRLFKGVEISNTKTKMTKDKMAVLVDTISNGFIFAPEVVNAYNAIELARIAKIVKDDYTLTPEQMNSSFHKSWSKVANASILQLYLEQILHYMTTYGFEQAGCFRNDTVYIPKEQLNVTGFSGEVILMVIKGYTAEQLTTKVGNMLSSGIALSKQSIQDFLALSRFVEDIDTVKNKEVQVGLYDITGKVPKNPIAFLRYVIYKTTNETLIIKNKKQIEQIKANSTVNAIELFNAYEKQNGLTGLASIFYRYKPLFLAFKHKRSMAPMINEIRRLAVHAHEPMKEDYLNTVTSRDKIVMADLKKALDKANLWRKVRLAYTLAYRSGNPESIAYRVRNGKIYAKAYEGTHSTGLSKVQAAVLASISKQLTPNVDGKKIYIPQHVHYAIPSSEKNFIGPIPQGSYIDVDSNMVFGVYWKNHKAGKTDKYGYSHEDTRVDIDLSMMNLAGTKYGWDGHYRRGDGQVLFSGDMTDATHGASELFALQRGHRGEYAIRANYFNGTGDKPVKMRVVIGSEPHTPSSLKKGHMIDPNNVLCLANIPLDCRQKMVGVVDCDGKNSRYYFVEVQDGNFATVRNSEAREHALRYMRDSFKVHVGLAEVLAMSGAELVDTKEEADIDLSPEVLAKDTIINLLLGK